MIKPQSFNMLWQTPCVQSMCLVWKTNKEESGAFPAYVLYHTDYSPGRKEQLSRDLRISNTEEHIMKLFEDMLAGNIKNG